MYIRIVKLESSLANKMKLESVYQKQFFIDKLSNLYYKLVFQKMLNIFQINLI